MHHIHGAASKVNKSTNASTLINKTAWEYSVNFRSSRYWGENRQKRKPAHALKPCWLHKTSHDRQLNDQEMSSKAHIFFCNEQVLSNSKWDNSIKRREDNNYQLPIRYLRWITWNVLQIYRTITAGIACHNFPNSTTSAISLLVAVASYAR